MAIFTPRGLKIRVPTEYAFRLMGRLYPETDAFRILQLAEEVENLGALATLLAALIAFWLRLTPVEIGATVFVTSAIFRMVHLFGLYLTPVPLLLLICRVYSRISGYGVFFLGLCIVGYYRVGWRGLVAYLLARATCAILFEFVELVRRRRALMGEGLYLPGGSERSFIHAFRLEAARLGKPTHLQLSDDESQSERWRDVLADLANKWPVIVSRFTEDIGIMATGASPWWAGVMGTNSPTDSRSESDS